MKCPKCKYVSFEYLEKCKKCGIDLTKHKSTYGIDFPLYASLGIPAFVAKNSATAEEGSADADGSDVAIAEDSALPDIAGEAFKEVASASFDADGVPVATDETTDAVAIAKEVGDADIDISGEDDTDETGQEISLVEEEEKEIAFTGLGEEQQESYDSTKEFSLDEIGGAGAIAVAEEGLSLDESGDTTAKAEESKDDEEIEISLDGIDVSTGDVSTTQEEPSGSLQPIYEDTSSIVLDEDALDSITGEIDKEKEKKAEKDIDGDDSLVVNLDDLDLD